QTRVLIHQHLFLMTLAAVLTRLWWPIFLLIAVVCRSCPLCVTLGLKSQDTVTQRLTLQWPTVVCHLLCRPWKGSLTNVSTILRLPTSMASKPSPRLWAELM